MSLAAKTIRQAVVKMLKEAGTRAEDRVFGNRTRPVWKETMPCLLVFTRDETAIQLFQVSPRVYARPLTLSVMIVDEELGEPDDIIDDKLDELAEAVERVLTAEPGLRLADQYIYPGGDTTQRAVGGFELQSTLLKSVELVTFTPPDDRAAENPLSGARITFEVVYLWPAPEGYSEDLEDFLGLDLRWKLKPGDELDDAHDRIDLRAP